MLPMNVTLWQIIVPSKELFSVTPVTGWEAQCCGCVGAPKREDISNEMIDTAHAIGDGSG